MRLQQMNQALSAFSRCVQQDMEIGESRWVGILPFRLVLIPPVILNPPFFILSFHYLLSFNSALYLSSFFFFLSSFFFLLSSFSHLLFNSFSLHPTLSPFSLSPISTYSHSLRFSCIQLLSHPPYVNPYTLFPSPPLLPSSFSTVSTFSHPPHHILLTPSTAHSHLHPLHFFHPTLTPSSHSPSPQSSHIISYTRPCSSSSFLLLLPPFSSFSPSSLSVSLLLFLLFIPPPPSPLFLLPFFHFCFPSPLPSLYSSSSFPPSPFSPLPPPPPPLHSSLSLKVRHGLILELFTCTNAPSKKHYTVYKKRKNINLGERYFGILFLLRSTLLCHFHTSTHTHSLTHTHTHTHTPLIYVLSQSLFLTYYVIAFLPPLCLLFFFFISWPWLLLSLFPSRYFIPCFPFQSFPILTSFPLFISLFINVYLFLSLSSSLMQFFSFTLIIIYHLFLFSRNFFFCSLILIFVISNLIEIGVFSRTLWRCPCSSEGSWRMFFPVFYNIASKSFTQK